MPSLGRNVAPEFGLDFDAHRSRELDLHDLSGFDLILTMARAQARELVAADADAWPRIFTLKQFARWIGDNPRPPRVALGPWLDAAAGGRPRATILGASDADDEKSRRAAIAKLLPMQRADFVELFEIMAGLPAQAAVFADSSPVFETLDGFKGTVLARYKDSGSPLLSGYLIGEKYLNGKAAALVFADLRDVENRAHAAIPGRDLAAVFPSERPARGDGLEMLSRDRFVDETESDHCILQKLDQNISLFINLQNVFFVFQFQWSDGEFDWEFCSIFPDGEYVNFP